jgi:hypothetical protein
MNQRGRADWLLITGWIVGAVGLFIMAACTMIVLIFLLVSQE